MIIEQFTDPAGKIRILWQSAATGNRYWFKFDEQPTTGTLEALSDNADQIADDDTHKPLSINLLDYRNIIVRIAQQIKANPNLTLTQYNNYLASLPWHEASVIRFFVFALAERLAERKDVTLANLNESTVLQAVRDFIVNTPGRKLARLIFGETDGITN